MPNITVARQYINAIEGELGMLQHRVEAIFAPDAYIDERIADIRIYLEQLRIELDPYKGQDAAKLNKRQGER